MKIAVSVAVSADGCMDDCSPDRLALSSPGDWQEVYKLRATCDAILVGASTLRTDNPSLQIKEPALRAGRIENGLPADILRVSVSRSGDLDQSLKFFTGPGRPLLFLRRANPALAGVADIEVMETITARGIVAALEKRGVERLLIEGGPRTLAMFFREGLVDRVRYAVAPLTVGDPAAPHFRECFEYLPQGFLVEKISEPGGGMTVKDYINADRHYLRMAIEQSRLSPPVNTAYRVGAVIVTSAGDIFKGYTHQTGPANHAEEEAIAKAFAAGVDLRGATIYSSMEPCSSRSSKPVSCSELIINHGFARTIYALAEPDNFVCCQGRAILQQGGVKVTVFEDLAAEVRRINSHLLSC